MSESGELLSPSQLFQQAAQADDSNRHSELGQRRGVGPQLGQPPEDVGIAAQLFQRADLWMVSTQVSQKQVGRTVILTDRGFAECRGQRLGSMLEQLRQRMLERRSSGSHIYEGRGGRMCCATARAYC